MTTENTNGEWMIVKRKRILHRKTFIKGKLLSKYYGELDYLKNAEGLIKEKYFDFTLYEASINNSLFRTNNQGPFIEFNSEEIFKGHIKPSPLPCKIFYQDIDGEFEIVLHELKLANIDFNKHRLLHQDEGDFVFGTMEADISGYILEEFEEEYDEKVLISKPTVDEKNETTLESSNPKIQKTNIPTGHKKILGSYTYYQYYYSDYVKKYWGKPVYNGITQPGCLEIVWPLIGILFGVMFLIAIGPKGFAILLSILAIGIVVMYFSSVLTWVFRIAGALMLIMSLIGFVLSLKNPQAAIRPFAKDDVNEVSEVSTIDTNKDFQNDSIITHHRIWKDYQGNQYEGDIWIRVKDLTSSSNYKNNLVIAKNDLAEYDRVLFNLRNADSSQLYGVYPLLDSIGKINNLNRVQFAEMIVSLVQDMPYSLILDNACDAKLYNDRFIKKYILNKEGDCFGYQRFGINSPVEFIASLKGDCDSRTLLLYTIFNHYNYDVAILSSEFYAHSILAVNLPFIGKSINYKNKKYTVWETTSPGIRPGVLPEEISDFKNWRISLLSKP